MENPIQLTIDQITRKRGRPAPNVSGYNSLFFHPSTTDCEPKKRPQLGKELSNICKRDNITYYFFKVGGRKINVYPNEVIESWWSNRK